jgi:16S rRNA (guanine527-N7)-methyltransferase
LAAERDPPTTVRDPVSEHIADSLSGLDVTELRAAGRIADIGSGAGFPGLPLAVALPASQVELVESAQRRCQVIDRLAAGAGIENARSVAARAEEWACVEGKDAYEAVTARALAPLAVLLEYAAPLLQHGGALVAWKGARDAGEEAGAETAAEELGMAPAKVVKVEPFEGARDRHLHVFTKEDPTPPRFPRRPGMARKRPLG